MIIYEDGNVKLEYDSAVPCIIWAPLKFMKGDDWRFPFTKGVDFLREKIKSVPNITWLNDSTKLKTVAMDDLKWLNSNVNDVGFKLGIKKIAFVLPENIFGRMAVKFYVDYTNKRTDNQFEIKAFRKYIDAENWLKTAIVKNEESNIPLTA
jgi:hypothetical protein